MPRRLVWVVDRRVVVDQATEEAERILERLDAPELAAVRMALASLSVSGDPLAISTLRGERADNRLWSEDPSRPAIIVGTVDMIGSRLLFSGYGVSRRWRARQAALLARDTLLVNDEAHLTPAFSKLIKEIESRVTEETDSEQPLRFLKLSATQRGEADEVPFPGSLDEDEAEHEVFRKRYRAVKRLKLVASDDAKAIEKLAIESKGRTIVFVKTPEKARKIARAIESARKPVAGDVPLITGEQRGKERDELIATEAFRRFLEGAAPTADCWLVATSAGEVGVNISCDRLISEFDTADHLLQRFGRLNRFGETDGTATVIYSPKALKSNKASEAERQTLKYLQSLDGDVSPKTLRAKSPPPDCLSPEPRCAPVLPWHIDVWSMTSLTDKDWPSRPEVGPWLRGDDADSPPETYVCWRQDVRDLARPSVSNDDRDEVFHCFPVLAKERLKQLTYRLCAALEKSEHGDEPALLVRRDRRVTVVKKLKELIDPRERSRMHYATLVLPLGVGALDVNGTVDWNRTVDKDKEGWDLFDVSAVAEGERRRSKTKLDPGEEPEVPNGLRERYRVHLMPDDEAEKAASWRYYTVSRATKMSSVESLAEHQRKVAGAAEDLGRRLLGAGNRTVEVLRWAAERHDLGKDCPVWQLYAQQPQDEPPRAKSNHFLNPSVLDGYRHELGSLLAPDAVKTSELSEEEHELALHLIAAHHGWARPHFPERTFAKRSVRASRQVALETARRFARLQRRCGAWGLAYLEALFCAADAMASRESPEDQANG